MERGVSVLTKDWDPPSHLARVCEGRERGVSKFRLLES